MTKIPYIILSLLGLLLIPMTALHAEVNEPDSVTVDEFSAEAVEAKGIDYIPRQRIEKYVKKILDKHKIKKQSDKVRNFKAAAIQAVTVLEQHGDREQRKYSNWKYYPNRRKAAQLILHGRCGQE